MYIPQKDNTPDADLPRRVCCVYFSRNNKYYKSEKSEVKESVSVIASAEVVVINKQAYNRENLHPGTSHKRYSSDIYAPYI